MESSLARQAIALWPANDPGTAALAVGALAADHLSGGRRRRVVRGEFERSLAIEDEEARAFSLTSLFPHLDDADRGRILEALLACEIPRIRAAALTAVLPLLADDVRRDLGATAADACFESGPAACYRDRGYGDPEGYWRWIWPPAGQFGEIPPPIYRYVPKPSSPLGVLLGRLEPSQRETVLERALDLLPPLAEIEPSAEAMLALDLEEWLDESDREALFERLLATLGEFGWHVDLGLLSLLQFPAWTRTPWWK